MTLCSSYNGTKSLEDHNTSILNVSYTASYSRRLYEYILIFGAVRTSNLVWQYGCLCI